MTFVKSENLKLVYVTADNINSNDVTAVFSTRNGGVSGRVQGTEYLNSLNLQLNSPFDILENVIENYRIITTSLDFKVNNVVAVHQIHTDNIIVVDNELVRELSIKQTNVSMNPHFFDESNTLNTSTPHILGEADALITNVKGIMLSIRTADCVPILLYDSVSKAIGAVHAGWKGTFMKIASKTVKRMGEIYGSNPRDIRVAIGPAIGICCYEVDKNFHEKFCQEYGEVINSYFRKQANGKPSCDLKALNKAFLCETGVPEANISVSDLCTMCHPELFYSHRRSGEKRGTMAAFIALK